ncbi:MAG: divergent polysaccharide deacetylase family protein [Desulfobacterales bacterium]|nr:divergent polysaccharide deacetylase family protein [Desulfobacterales bacterium]
MKEKNQEQRIQQCHRRLFLLKGVAYLSGALFGLNLFSNAKAGQSRIFPINTPPLEKLPLSEFAPRIAFIIDDIGSSISRAKAFLDLKMPMTFSILPKLQYSVLLAEEIYEQGQEIMLHQPMEPYRHEIDPGPGALYISNRDTEIEEIIEENISQIPQATGVNNHMGSRFTSNSDKVAEALKIIKQKDLFFVDSLTSSHSQAYKMARRLNMRTAPRNVFLDTPPDIRAVRRQLRHLKQYALKHGAAIGIGHPHLSTLTALYDFKQELNEKGPFFELVSVSDLLSERQSTHINDTNQIDG